MSYKAVLYKLNLIQIEAFDTTFVVCLGMW